MVQQGNASVLYQIFIISRKGYFESEFRIENRVIWQQLAAKLNAIIFVFHTYRLLSIELESIMEYLIEGQLPGCY